VPRRLALYTKILNDECRELSSSQRLVHLCLTTTNICLYIIAPFSLGRSNGMATDIGSLTAGLDGHVIRLVIGRNGLQKIVQVYFF
jgi:hypothetical protein